MFSSKRNALVSRSVRPQVGQSIQARRMTGTVWRFIGGPYRWNERLVTTRNSRIWPDIRGGLDRVRGFAFPGIHQECRGGSLRECAPSAFK
jgi:hypothetical protein